MSGWMFPEEWPSLFLGTVVSAEWRGVGSSQFILLTYTDGRQVEVVPSSVGLFDASHRNNNEAPTGCMR